MGYFPSLIMPIFTEKPINLSDLVFEDTVKSKLIYGVFFLSSFVAATASFAKVLKWGKKPVIKNYVTEICQDYPSPGYQIPHARIHPVRSY